MIEVTPVVDEAGDRRVGQFENCIDCDERFTEGQFALLVVGKDSRTSVIHEDCIMDRFSRTRKKMVDPRFESYRDRVAREARAGQS